MDLMLPDSVREGAVALKEQNPWAGNVEERKAKFQAFVLTASRDFLDEPTSPIGLLARGPEVIFEDVTIPAPSGSSGRSTYNGNDHQIIIRNKASVITLFWLFNHAAGASDPLPLAKQMFGEFFPEEDARLGAGTVVQEADPEDGPGMADEGYDEE